MEIAGSVGGILAHKGSAVWSIAPNAMVFDAIQLMAEKNIGALPVIEDGKLVGIISERDYTRKVILKGKVHSWFEREEAEKAAWRAPGVRAVEDKIAIGV